MMQYFLLIKQALFVGILITGLVGSVLFFPLRIYSNYTCLYHQLCDSGHPIMAQEPNMEGNTDGLYNHSASVSAKLLKHYIHGYAFFWWLSLILVAGGFYGLRHKRRSNTRHVTKTFSDNINFMI